MKFDTNMVEEVCKYIQLGLTYRDACKICRISEATFYLWQKKGRDGEAEYAEFFESLERAKITGKAALLQRILAASKKSWIPAAWLLERRYPDEFGRGYLKNTNEEDEDEENLHELKLDTSALTTEQLKQIKAIIEDEESK